MPLKILPGPDADVLVVGEARPDIARAVELLERVGYRPFMLHPDDLAEQPLDSARLTAIVAPFLGSAIAPSRLQALIESRDRALAERLWFFLETFDQRIAVLARESGSRLLPYPATAPAWAALLGPPRAEPRRWPGEEGFDTPAPPAPAHGEMRRWR